MLNLIKNKLFSSEKYTSEAEAVIIACFFNPQNSPYRLKVFLQFYETIKHLNHAIVECVIGDEKPSLPTSKHIKVIRTKSILWHKEALLNKIIADLPAKYKYVFWLDADVIFSNQNWLRESVQKLKNDYQLIQPFAFCVHLEKDETAPNFDLKTVTSALFPNQIHPKVWRGFAATYEKYPTLAANLTYNTYGHVGFAWGAKREILEKVPLFDRALIGGADQIMAMAAVGKFGHPALMKSFGQIFDEINHFSRKFYRQIEGKISYTEGNLFHLWHGELEKRKYLERIQAFTPISKNIQQKDANGLYIAESGDDAYVKAYFEHREVI